MRYNGLVNTKAVGVTAAADNKGFVLTTKRSKLSHKPAKAALAVTMKAGLGRSLHKTKASLNKQRYRKDLTKAAMRRAAAIVRPAKENIVIVLFIKNDATASSQRGTTTNG